MLQTLSVDSFSLPGEGGFPLNSLYKGPGDKGESGEYFDFFVLTLCGWSALENSLRLRSDWKADLSYNPIIPPLPLPLPPFPPSPLPPVTDALRSYLLQARQELSSRLCDRLYPIEPDTQPDGSETPQARRGQRVGRPSKWWMSFQKRK